MEVINSSCKASRRPHVYKDKLTVPGGVLEQDFITTFMANSKYFNDI